VDPRISRSCTYAPHRAPPILEVEILPIHSSLQLRFLDRMIMANRTEAATNGHSSTIVIAIIVPLVLIAVLFALILMLVFKPDGGASGCLHGWTNE
jgi:hypothetical protein